MYVKVKMGKVLLNPDIAKTEGTNGRSAYFSWAEITLGNLMFNFNIDKSAVPIILVIKLWHKL